MMSTNVANKVLLGSLDEIMELEKIAVLQIYC